MREMSWLLLPQVGKRIRLTGRWRGGSWLVGHGRSEWVVAEQNQSSNRDLTNEENETTVWKTCRLLETKECDKSK
jgi:hypothetical protein